MNKILVVEDDETVYSGIKKLLEIQHYYVEVAQNGLKALEKIDYSFSLVIMDVMMPQLDGIETCRKIREKYSVPILFLSAKSEEVDKLEGLEVGGDDYMTKPFSNMELMSKVKALIRRYQVYDNSGTSNIGKDAYIAANGI
uniref:response regulator transcription factor n=1 Tax=Agathobacter rectalis TaxID=39491 RepID=UPI004029CF35